jgi:hypothetical protein
LTAAPSDGCKSDMESPATSAAESAKDSGEEPVDLPFVWLEDSEWSKAIGQFRLKLGSYLHVFDCYGQQPYIDMVAAQIEAAAIDLTMRVRGEDRPIGEKHNPLPRQMGEEPDD